MMQPVHCFAGSSDANIKSQSVRVLDDVSVMDVRTVPRWRQRRRGAVWRPLDTYLDADGRAIPVRPCAYTSGIALHIQLQADYAAASLHLTIEVRWSVPPQVKVATRWLSDRELQRELHLFDRSRVGYVELSGRLGNVFPSVAKKKGPSEDGPLNMLSAVRFLLICHR